MRKGQNRKQIPDNRHPEAAQRQVTRAQGWQG